MSSELEELPLFTMPTVLFPFAQTRLHVFRPRCAELMLACARQSKPVGIALARPSGQQSGLAEPYLVGTVASILSVDEYDDGRIDVQVIGERRFRIRRLEELNDYMVGDVEPLVDGDLAVEACFDPIALSAQSHLQTFFERAFVHQGPREGNLVPDDPVALSFVIANLLAIDKLEQQRLLELTDTWERLRAVVPLLEAQNLEAERPALRRVSSGELADLDSLN